MDDQNASDQNKDGGSDADRLKHFDAEWYVKTYPDVAMSGLDPAQHYLRLGRALGRAGSAAEAAKMEDPIGSSIPEVAASNYGTDDQSVATVQPADITGPLIPAPDDIAAQKFREPHYPKRPANRGHPAIWTGQEELGRFRTAAEMDDLLGPLRLFCGLLEFDGKAPGPVQTEDDDGLRENFQPGLRTAAALPSCVAPAFLSGPTRFENVWYCDGATLRCFVAGSEDIAATGLGAVRAWQADGTSPEKLRPVGALTLPDSGPGFFDITLDNPLMPVLLELSDSEGFTLGFALMAFPSLLRGGLHAAERAAWQTGPNPMDEFWRLGGALLRELLDGPRRDGFSVTRLAVRTDGATGAERIFSDDMRDWLHRIFGLGLRSAPEDEATTAVPDDAGARYISGLLNDGMDRGASGLTLTLPAPAIPTIEGLVSRRMALPSGVSAAVSPFLVADTASHKPMWSVSLPLLNSASGDAPTVSQMTDAAAEDAKAEAPNWIAPLHMAVVFRSALADDSLLQTLPVAPDAPAAKRPKAVGPVSVVLAARDPETATRALKAIAQQAGADVSDVLIRPAPGDAGRTDAILDAAGRIFPDKVKAGPAQQGRAGELATALEQTRSARLLFIDDAVTLVDAQVLQTLWAMLDDDPKAASASCMLLHEDVSNRTARVSAASAGLFPGSVSLISAPRLTVVEPNVLTALPDATYPVLANTLSLCLVRRAALDETADARAALSGDADIELHLGLTGFAGGWRHVCTTRVRAGTSRPPSRRDDIDPFGLACLAPGRWDELLSAVTVLRELKG